MHELAIAQSIVTLAEEEARAVGGVRIRSITVALGAFSGVVEEQLRLCFPFACRQSLADGADLEIRSIPGRCRCRRCDTTFAPKEPRFEPCPRCGSFSVDIERGQELLLERVEVETGDGGVHANRHGVGDETDTDL